MTIAQIVCLISAMVWMFIAGVAAKDGADGGIGGLFVPLILIGVVTCFMGAFL
jgi:hypothetical protein